MSYINEDKSILYSKEVTGDTTLGEIALDTNKKINSIIDPILKTMYTRVDTRDNDRINYSPPTGEKNYNLVYEFRNVYQLNNDNNYLICTIRTVLLYYTTVDWNITVSQFRNLITTPRLGCQIILSYSRTNVENDGERSVDANVKNLPYSSIDNIVNGSSSIAFVDNTTNFSLNFPMRLITLNNDNNQLIGKFIVVGTNSELAVPHVGIVQINGTAKNMISILSSYASNTNEIQANASISNILILDGDIFRRAVPNLLSNYSFSNSQQKMPLVPLYLATSDSTSTYNYDFSKPILNFYQTSSEYATNLGTRYTLNNKNYLSMGNHLLIEEGSIV